MTLSNIQARAELYLGSDEASALAQGPRAFSSPAKALKFAFEQAAPVSLRGARLQIGSTTFTGEALAELYRRQDFAQAKTKTALRRTIQQRRNEAAAKRHAH